MERIVVDCFADVYPFSPHLYERSLLRQCPQYRIPGACKSRVLTANILYSVNIDLKFC